MERAAGTLEAVRRKSRAHRDWNGGDRTLPRESLPRVRAERLSTPSVASRANAPLSSATGLTGQDRSARRHDHCPPFARDGEERVGYIPSEQIATYRELVRLHTQLGEECARYQNQIHALVVVLFPEFTQVIADPCGPAALAVLKAYPSAQAVAQAGVEAVYQVLHALPAAHFGRPTAKKLVTAAQASVSSGRALNSRAGSLRILCDQLAHTQVNLKVLEEQLEQLIAADASSQGLAANAGTGSQIGGGLTR